MMNIYHDDFFNFLFQISLIFLCIGAAGAFYMIFGEAPIKPRRLKNVREGILKPVGLLPRPVRDIKDLVIPDIPPSEEVSIQKNIEIYVDPVNLVTPQQFKAQKSKALDIKKMLNTEVPMEKVTLTEIYKNIAAREAGNSRVKYGDIREIIGIVADMLHKNPAGVFKALDTLGKKRLKTGNKKPVRK
jgi:hypothetical protein